MVFLFDRLKSKSDFCSYRFDFRMNTFTAKFNHRRSTVVLIFLLNIGIKHVFCALTFAGFRG